MGLPGRFWWCLRKDDPWWLKLLYRYINWVLLWTFWHLRFFVVSDRQSSENDEWDMVFLLGYGPVMPFWGVKAAWNEHQTLHLATEFSQLFRKKDQTFVDKNRHWSNKSKLELIQNNIRKFFFYPTIFESIIFLFVFKIFNVDSITLWKNNDRFPNGTKRYTFIHLLNSNFTY